MLIFRYVIMDGDTPHQVLSEGATDASATRICDELAEYHDRYCLRYDTTQEVIVPYRFHWIQIPVSKYPVFPERS